MRYGAERKYQNDDLGKFGLGLKTASMSQCQCLSVASRWNGERANIAAFSWDLDHIERTNRWEILPIERDMLGQVIRDPLMDTTGTVVLWRRIDRILGYKHPYGEFARKKVLQLCRTLEGHLGMVFHRFLAGEVRGKRLKLLINRNEIKPWDPFCRQEPKIRSLPAKTIPLEYDSVAGEVKVEPFILPHQVDFSTPDAFHGATGPEKWNQQQGFYIYRSNRMIQSGGWSNLRASDEHTKLARIAVSFSPMLDEAFKINVSKMRVQMPSSIHEELNNIIAPVVKLAREYYDRKEKRQINFSPTLLDNSAPNQSFVNHTGAAAINRQPCSKESHSEQLLTFEDWTELLVANATKQELPVIKAVLERLKQ